MRRLALALALVFLALVAPAAAQQDGVDRPASRSTQVRPEIAQRVTRALFVIEGEAPASFYASLGDEGRDTLLAFVRDRTRSVGLRRRATLALRHYPQAEVRVELEGLASDLGEDAIVSRYAVRSLALGFGPSSFESVRVRLDDPRALVREGAAMELASLDAARARPLLTARVRQESERFVRERLERLLATP